MRMSSKNIWLPKSKKIKKISLGIKGFIGTVCTGAYFDGSPHIAFWGLVSGALIDFALEFLPNDETTDQ